MKRRLLHGLLAIALLGLWLGGCDGCRSDQVTTAIATLSAVVGPGVARDYAASPRVWQPAQVGTTLSLGDGAQTDEQSTAELTFINGATLDLKPSTTVRLLPDGIDSEQTAFDVQAGEAVLRVGKRGLSLRTHVGLALIEPESEVLLRRSGNSIGFEVSLGALNFRDTDAGEIQLRSGDSVDVGIGMAVLGLRRADEEVREGEGADDAGVALDGDAGELEALPTGPGEPGPPYRHLLASAGESFTVHTPEVPVSVGLSLGTRCKGDGLLEVSGPRQLVRGTGDANVLLQAGSHSYSLRCLSATGAPGRVVARGSVQVLVDAGTRRLPPKAPMTHVEADGRTYRIHYQNQLPEVLVRWPNAPAQTRYRLELDGKPVEIEGPEHLFHSGTLTDGVHTIAFQAEGRRSRTTTVEVHFDNVAPKASLSAPDDRGFGVGDTVTVEGVALPSWKVAVHGGTIATAGGDRFSGRVQTTPEAPHVAVRLSHPRLGTHYYLRRASGTP